MSQCFKPGRYCEKGSLKNKDFRGQYGRGFLSRATAIVHVERCPLRRDTVQCVSGRRWPAARYGGALSPTRGGRGHFVPRLDPRCPAAAEASVAWASDAPTSRRPQAWRDTIGNDTAPDVSAGSARRSWARTTGFGVTPH